MQSEALKLPTLDLALAVWSRRKWLALLVFAAPFAAAVSTVKFLPNIYRSKATILVQHQQVPEAFVRTTVTGGLETRLQTISQEILSRSRLEDLITRFNLYAQLRERAPLEAVIERMRHDIQLDPKGIEPRWGGGGITAFTVGYRGNDPQTVALVANTLASFYIEENLKVRERQAVGTAEFLRAQLQEVKQRLAEQERRVSEFNRRNIGELPHQLQANLAILGRSNEQLRLNSESQIRTREHREVLAKQLAEAGSLTEVGSSKPAGAPESPAVRIARLKQTLADLRTRFSEKYPDVMQAKSEIAALEQQVAEARNGSEPGKEQAAPVSSYAVQLKQAVSEVDAQMKVLKAEEQRLRGEIAAYQQRIENTPRREQELQDLTRDYTTTKDLYQTLLRRFDEAQLAESLEQRQKGEQFRILEPAKASAQPAAPIRQRLILMGFMLSLGLAAGAVMLAEQLDTSFHTVDDLRAFSKVPVLVCIPRIVTRRDRRRRRWWFGLVAVLAMVGVVLIVVASYFIAHGNEQLVWMLPGKAS